jgi:hypothetical protein
MSFKEKNIFFGRPERNKEFLRGFSVESLEVTPSNAYKNN